MILRLYYSKHFSDMLQIVFPFFFHERVSDESDGNHPLSKFK